MNFEATERSSKIDSLLFSVFTVIIIFVYYFLPKSLTLEIGGDFRLIPLYLKPWFAQRYLLLAVCGLFFLVFIFRGRGLINVNFLCMTLVLCLVGFVAYLGSGGVFLYAYVGMAASYVIGQAFHGYYFDNKLIYRLVVFSLACYVIQYFFYRVGGRVVASYLDPNISGYYLFLAYAFFRYSGLRVLSLLALVVGLLSLSRNFILAVFVFEFFKTGYISFFVNRSSLLRSPFVWFFTSFFAVLVFSFSMLGMAEINATIGDSSDRLSNIVDGSNYSRAKANIVMIERVLDGEFLFFGNGDNVDLKTEHRPHNAFLRAIYRYGAIITCLLFFVSLVAMRLVASRTFPLMAGVFCYYSILNDFVSGPELILFLLISILASSYEKKTVSYKFIFRRQF